MKYKIIPRKVGKVDPTTKETKHQFLLEVGTSASATGRRYITLDICESLDWWDKDNSIFVVDKSLRSQEGKARNTHNKQLNALLSAIKTKCDNIIIDFDREKVIATPTQFVERYTSKVGIDAKVAEYFTERISSLRDTGHTGNANCYHRTLEMLRLFDKRFDKLLFADVNIRYVKRFNEWMQKERTTTYKYKNTTIERKRSGCSGNTRKYYHKALRAILNSAITDKVYDGRSYPYGKGGFEVGGLEQVTDKRYLSTEVMQAIRNTPLNDMRLEVVRRMFICQYLCYGISWADAGLLTRKNIITVKDGKCIAYKRTKTKHAKNVKPIVIHIRQELQDHLDWFRENCDLVDDYIFPIVSISGYTGEQLYEHIRSRFRRNNKILKNDIAPIFGVEDMKLTSYVTRHTVAMTLQSQEVSREKISQVLGHSDMKTTNTYLDSFDSDEIKKATDNL